MNTFQITTFTGSLQNQPTELINARDLYELLQVRSHFKDWIRRRLSESKFRLNLDFIEMLKIERVERGFFGEREIEVKDYHLTIDTAKHICLMENNEIGYQIRQKFIENDHKARQEIPRLQAENAELKQQLAQIPLFMRDPDVHLKLLEQAQNALFTTYPECKAIVRYREMGLNNGEIAVLLGVAKSTVERRLTKLFDLGLLVRKQQPSPQLALGLNG